MTFKNINTLFKHIEKDICDTLQKEVAETVKDNMTVGIQKSVYNAYSPEYYSRRMEQGGLIDKRNMESTVSGNTLTVRNITPLDNGKTDFALDDIIVNGYGKQPFPRDFYSETVNILSVTGEHTEALKKGLKNKGYTVK